MQIIKQMSEMSICVGNYNCSNGSSQCYNLSVDIDNTNQIQPQQPVVVSSGGDM